MEALTSKPDCRGTEQGGEVLRNTAVCLYIYTAMIGGEAIVLPEDAKHILMVRPKCRTLFMFGGQYLVEPDMLNPSPMALPPCHAYYGDGSSK